ncbi:hypothetical protein SU69_06535 [Thermosipho melanesiensis]|uniref:Uncharacterized protein n=2 Tax=Thermosipho melanesiensis TaxID=46541 RepID=A6LMI8_THEM4|nr:hypothetical protein [Thermosipho melanesiensis]ABR31139.1 hypothetical protein Tmel_1290 [Thermosipho melanesiensis BI429]APT74230.1 hypothetical protein BW47_06855 [Thermosipho melanesiensis]OOC36172.1 hypothetical protein SU68_06605 [Thermosipho melanesiensis]OOC36990.1 hypothetical protein SU69_06535 [Thermosipho melanesiensis]OOC37742.1 hypothetical protein SU70_06545 [Thermosipho melanesiensis]
MEKRGKLLKVLLAFIIAILVVSLIFVFSYFSFLLKNVYGIEDGVFSYIKSYSAYLLNKIPVLNKYIKYEPLKVNEPKKFFTEVLDEYKKNIEELIKQSEKKLKQAEKLRSENELLYNSLKSIEEKWKERKIQEELSQIQVFQTSKNLDKLVEIFKNGDANALIPLMNSEDINVDTLAVIFQQLSPDLRSEMVQALASVNPTKAAAVVNKIYDVKSILNEIETKLEALRNNINNLYSLQAQLVSLEGFNKAIRGYLSSLDEEEIYSMINLYKDSPRIVYYLISNIDISISKKLLRRLKNENEKLFVELIKLGGGIE